jgi:hypothetical protein
MTEKDYPTESNGYESLRPKPEMTADELRSMLGDEFGIDGGTPGERLAQMKELSPASIASLIDDINKRIQGSTESLRSDDKVMRIGDTETIHPADRYEVFMRLVEAIKQTPESVNPARVGDVLAMGVVLLHPFQDGNGRTARILGLVLRDEYDGQDYESDYNTIAEPRDQARARGGFMIYGYTPRFPDGFNQSDPEQVSGYLADLLVEEKPGAYYGCFGQAPLSVV